MFALCDQIVRKIAEFLQYICVTELARRWIACAAADHGNRRGVSASPSLHDRHFRAASSFQKLADRADDRGGHRQVGTFTFREGADR
jgi:hypothetical protein